MDDGSLDARAAPIVKGHGKRALGDASLELAARFHEAPSPAMVEGDAEWIEIAGELVAAGLTPSELRRVCERATARAYKKEGPSEEVLAHLFPDASPAIRDTPTAEAQKALDYLLARHRQARAVRTLETFVEWAHGRSITVDAPELATMDAWLATTDARRHAIATLVGDAFRRHLDHGDGGGAWNAMIESYGGPPIAVIARGKRRFSIVPGGTVEVGFSEEEEAAVRAQAEVRDGCSNHHELYEALFECVDVMRPIVRAIVGPMLAMQGDPEPRDRKEAHGALVESLLAVPSEAEWEYLARGGRSRELTYRGDVVPDSRDEYLATLDEADPPNELGLRGFGLFPEICADAWSESHDERPVDGSPRRGAGPRTVRGGAAMVSPWQDTGEWHMLLTAFRMPDTVWKHSLATRYILRIRCR